MGEIPKKYEKYQRKREKSKSVLNHYGEFR